MMIQQNLAEICEFQSKRSLMTGWVGGGVGGWFLLRLEISRADQYKYQTLTEWADIKIGGQVKMIAPRWGTVCRPWVILMLTCIRLGPD